MDPQAIREFLTRTAVEAGLKILTRSFSGWSDAG